MARLEKNDDLDKWDQKGFDLVERNDRKFFKLSCSKLDGARCTIYQQKRPQVCGGFKCRVLKNAEAGKISWEDAKLRVNGAIELTSKINAGLEKSGIDPKRNYAQITEYLQRRLQETKDNAEKTRIARILLNIEVFNEIIFRYFKTKKKNGKNGK